MQGEGRRRARDREGEGCSFVAEQHPEDVDPENKSTVLRFHPGKRLRNSPVCTVKKKERKKLWESDICSVFVRGSNVNSFPRHL